MNNQAEIIKMDRGPCEIVAVKSKTLAQEYIRANNFGRAFSHYLVALKLCPSWRAELKEVFSTVLYRWGRKLERQGRHNDLFKCYEEAIHIFPENEYILNNLGAHLLKYGAVKEAANYFRKSLKIRPEFLRALQNLENTSNMIVERWHFRMLNDRKRNNAFREAIREKVIKGYDSILDIGTGTGILSLFAMEAGARTVIACESSGFMADIANEVFGENNATAVRLINKHSSDLKCPEDMPERVKLVVTEIVDCGLLGEGILETLTDAWDRLLLAPGSDSAFQLPPAVIPLRAAVFISGIECVSIRTKYFLTVKQCGSLVLDDCCIEYFGSDYDSECLISLPNGFNYVTNICEAFYINFNDCESMKKIFSGDWEKSVTLKVCQTGRLDCLAMWFDLYVDEINVLSSAPGSESCQSWDQAIFPVRDDLRLSEGDEIVVRIAYVDGKLLVRNLRMNTSTRLLIDKRPNVFHPSEVLLRMLNSTVYEKCFMELCDLVETRFKCSVAILDTFPFPIFGLNYLLRRRDIKNVLTCVVGDERDREILEYIAKKYGLENQVQIFKEDMLIEEEICGLFDVILLNLVEQTGEMKDRIILNFDVMKTALKTNGLLFPEEVTGIGQLIESEWLETMSGVVDDDSTFGYRIGKFINVYQANIHLDFDFNSVPKVTRTEPFAMWKAIADQFTCDLTVPIISEGTANALAYWFKIKFASGVSEISTLTDGVTNQSAILFPTKLMVNSASLRIVYDHGLFRLIRLCDK